MKQYKVYYKVTVGGDDIKRDIVLTATDPIAALDAFHKMMQFSKPPHGPDTYTLGGMFQYYYDTPPKLGGTGELIESPIDLPRTPNPTLKVSAPKAKPPETMEMDLDDARLKPVFTD